MISGIEIRKPLTPHDFESMWRLNHDVFSVELRQHSIHDDGLLIDKFHHKNIYYIAAHENEAIGMISAHWKTPFSFEQKFRIDASAIYMNEKIGEVRLLCVKRKYRHSSIATGLLLALVRELRLSSINRILISGINEQKHLYEHIGFRVIGESVKDGNAFFHPMSANRDDIENGLGKILNRFERKNILKINTPALESV